MIDLLNQRFRFGGVEEAYNDVNAYELLPILLERHGYSRVFIVSSKTLNTKTDVVRKLEACLEDKWVGTTHEVGEHSPLNNVLKGAIAIKEAKAELIIGIGGGSVLDFVKFVQLCITEEVYDKPNLLELQAQVESDFTFIYSSTKIPKIRTLAIPTTMSTAEWTPGGTPVVEETKQKAAFFMKWGSPQIVIYDPDIVALTPKHLLIATAVRGLDHSINSACSVGAHPIARIFAEQAIQLYMKYLPLLNKDVHDREAMNQCQIATALCSLGQMSAVHGFSHFMGHVIAPYFDLGHSETACVLMLIQAKWLKGHADKYHTKIAKSLGREGTPFHQILEEFLIELDMPTDFAGLGLSSAQLDEVAPMAMDHPLLTKFNLRPLDTPADVRALLAFGE